MPTKALKYTPRLIMVLTLIVCLLMSYSCLTPPPPPPKVIFSTPEQTSTPPATPSEPTPLSTSTPESTPATTPSPPVTPPSPPTPQPPQLTIALDHFGTINTIAKVRLVVLVKDDRGVLVNVPIPEEIFPAFDMADLYQVRSIGRDPVVYKGPIVGSLSVCVAAYDVSSGPMLKSDFETVARFFGMPGVDVIKNAIPDKKLVGHYSYTWTESSNWGIGAHDNKGEGDLKVWMRIWADQVIPPTQQPSILPAGTHEVNVEVSSWPLTRGASESFVRYLNANERLTGTVDWLTPQSIVYDWSLYIYGPDRSVVLSWSGRDLRHNFSLTAVNPGTYTIEILKRDYFARRVRLTIEPAGWEKAR